MSSATDVVVSVGGGSATSGTDYTGVSNFTVTIPKETASGSGTFTLTPTQDTIAEGDETIDVTGSATDFTVTKAEMTLTDDDTASGSITLTVSPTSVGEDDDATTVTVTATLDGSVTLLTATTVTVSVGGGSATSGTDYTAVSNFTVTIPRETASGTGTFTLTPTQDTIAEGDETIDVTGSATDFTVTKAEVTLTDDETAPGSITLTVSPASVSEDDGATTVTVTATLGGSATLPDATEVTVSVGGGSATSGTDYTAVSNFTVTIPKESASETGTFTLTPTNDSLAEGEETIDVTGTATGFTVTGAQVTLTDDAPPVKVSFAQASYTVAEGGTVTVTVELSAVPEREVEVALTHTAQDDTTAGDYSGVPSSVTFDSDETEQTFTFTAAADDVDDDGDSVLLGFGTPLPDGVSAGATATSTVSITDDDVPRVQVFFEPDAYTVAEDSAVTVTVRLDVAPERLVSVPITVANQGDTSAADYAGAPTLVVFAGDETEQSFPFGAADDTVDDDGESVVLGFGELPDRVSAPDTTARPASATVSITDDDTASASITLTTLPATVSESASQTTVTVTATLGGERDVEQRDRCGGVGGRRQRHFGHGLHGGLELHGDDPEGDRERERDVHPDADPGHHRRGRRDHRRDRQRHRLHGDEGGDDPDRRRHGFGVDHPHRVAHFGWGGRRRNDGHRHRDAGRECDAPHGDNGNGVGGRRQRHFGHGLHGSLELHGDDPEGDRERDRDLHPDADPGHHRRGRRDDRRHGQRHRLHGNQG